MMSLTSVYCFVNYASRHFCGCKPDVVGCYIGALFFGCCNQSASCQVF